MGEPVKKKWVVISDEDFTESDAKKYQEAFGYKVSKHGFENFKIEDLPDGSIRCVWYCNSTAFVESFGSML